MKFRFLIILIHFLGLGQTLQAQIDFVILDEESELPLKVDTFYYTLESDAEERFSRRPLAGKFPPTYRVRESRLQGYNAISIRIVKDGYLEKRDTVQFDPDVKSTITILLQKKRTTLPPPIQNIKLLLKDAHLNQPIQESPKISFNDKAFKSYQFGGMKYRVNQNQIGALIHIRVKGSNFYENIDTTLELVNEIELSLKSKKKVRLQLTDGSYDNVPLEDVDVRVNYPSGALLAGVPPSNFDGKIEFIVSPLAKTIQLNIIEEGYQEVSNRTINLTSSIVMEVHEILMEGSGSVEIKLFDKEKKTLLDDIVTQQLTFQYQVDSLEWQRLRLNKADDLLDNLSPNAKEITIKIEDERRRFYREYERTFDLNLKKKLECYLANVQNTIRLQFIDERTGEIINQQLGFNYLRSSDLENIETKTTQGGDKAITIDIEDTFILLSAQATTSYNSISNYRIRLEANQSEYQIPLMPLYQMLAVNLYLPKGKKMEDAKVIGNDVVAEFNDIQKAYLLEITTKDSMLSLAIERNGYRPVNCNCNVSLLEKPEIRIVLKKRKRIKWAGLGLGLTSLIKSEFSVKKAKAFDNRNWKEDGNKAQIERLIGVVLSVPSVFFLTKETIEEKTLAETNTVYCECLE